MVLIHKLKQVEGIDVQQLREQQNDHDSAAGEGGLRQRDDLPRLVEGTQDSQTEFKTSITRSISPPRRPLTRSQTGYVPKRRPRDDSPARAVKASSAAPRKRSRASGPRKQAIEDPEQTEDELTPEHVTHAPDVSSDVALQSQAVSNGDTSIQLTFLNSNADGSISLDARRAPRSRVVLPTPVPNLTKKSRGRRVPTTISTDQSGDTKDARVYVCQVDGCGKCFYRGEHLKRHIRSIHTHEKPFKCTYAQCEKLFNRHDNLLQHLKVHREPIKRIRQSSSGSSADTEHDDDVNLASSSKRSTPSPVSSRVVPQTHHFPDLYKPTAPAIHPISRLPLPTTVVSYSSIATYTALPSSVLSSEPLGFSTNMAVSSIRTEIPASPRSAKAIGG